MRTYEGALVALDTLGNIPLRYVDGNTTLLISRSTAWEGTVCQGLQSLDGQLVALLTVDWVLDIADVLREMGLILSLAIYGISPGSWYLYLMKCIDTCINGTMVHINDVLTLLAIGGNNSVLQILYSSINRNNISQLEESRLHYHVEAAPKS